MKTLWILAAAATFAACHNRSEETGAAPNRGDTTAVTPSKAGNDTTANKPTPSAGYDTTAARPTTPPSADTTMKQPTIPPSAGYDTTSTQPIEVEPRQEPGDTSPMPRPTDSRP